MVPLGEPILLDRRQSVETPDGRLLFLPSGEGDWGEFTQTTQPGLYRVFNENNNLVGGFAVQAGSALESNLTQRFQPAALTKINPTITVSPEPEYFKLWPWLAGVALIFIVVEGWLAWRR